MQKQTLIHHFASFIPERRKHIRIPLRLPTEYSILGKEKTRICHTDDIGEGGVLLCLPEEVSVGLKLKIRLFYYFESDIRVFEAVGKVVWSEKGKASEKKLRCALEFIEISPRNLEKLRKFFKGIIN